MRTKRLLAAAAAAGLFVLSACGANTAPSGNDEANAGTGSNEATKGTVGVILPETATSSRWVGFDKPLLEKALRAEGFEADVQNAQGRCRSSPRSPTA